MMTEATQHTHGAHRGAQSYLNLRVGIKKVFSEAWTSKQKPPSKE